LDPLPKLWHGPGEPWELRSREAPQISAVAEGWPVMNQWFFYWLNGIFNEIQWIFNGIFNEPMNQWDFSDGNELRNSF
jgi:hypothetical protein